MNDIVVVFPKKEVAINIRNVLVRGGIDVYGVCTTGAQVLQAIDNLDEGVIICGYRLKDMVYTQLRPGAGRGRGRPKPAVQGL